MTTPTRTACCVDDLLRQVSVDPGLDGAAVADETLDAEDVTALRRELPTLVYEVLHAGHRQRPGTLPFRIRDVAFERSLAAAVPHTQLRAPVVPVPLPPGATPYPGHVLVERDGVRVWTPEPDVRPDADGQVRTTVPAARPGLSPGFFLIDSSAPRTLGGPVLRVYVHVTDAAAAPPVWATVVDHLERAGASYRAKVLSARSLYPRRDAVVLYLPATSWHLTDDLVDVLAGADGLGSPTSALARRLGPGLASAWEPEDPRDHAGGLSFGQHRASVLAHALIDAARAGTDPRATVVEAFLDAGIDPDDVSRNVGSPDRPGAPAGTAGDRSVLPVRSPDTTSTHRGST